MPLPDTVHHHAGAQWRAHNPLRQRESSTARAGRHRFSAKDGKPAARNFLSGLFRVATLLQTDVDRPRLHHRKGHWCDWLRPGLRITHANNFRFLAGELAEAGERRTAAPSRDVFQ